MTENMRLGIRLGLFLAPLALLLALPLFSFDVRLSSIVEGPGYWIYWVQNLPPLLALALIGGLAARRGYGPASTGLWAGIAYGFVAGFFHYGVEALASRKRALAEAAWNAYLARGYSGDPASRRVLTASILHPNPLAFISKTGLEFALVGLAAGLVGGWLMRLTASPRPPSVT